MLKFSNRHIGPTEAQVREMLQTLGASQLSDLMESVIPRSIISNKSVDLPPALSEKECIEELQKIASENQIFRSFIGMGYSGTVVPPVIQRNILENPGWYTQYTPYQAEISQGRLQALLNFQTMVSDLTGLEVANASMLDEGTSAAEAMTMSYAIHAGKRAKFLVSSSVHPQTIAVVQTRAKPMGIEVEVGEESSFEFNESVFGVLLQYPNTHGSVEDYADVVTQAKNSKAVISVAADLMSLTLLRPPGEWGADICVGSTQRFGVPMGYGGPHAAFFATRDEHKRRIPGRIVGVSTDKEGNPAVRLALQTREQHIRREKATSNICTAQALLAIMSSMYAVYHGPEGLKSIALSIHHRAMQLADSLKALGLKLESDRFFDTVSFSIEKSVWDKLFKSLKKAKINLRVYEASGKSQRLGVSLDEKTTEDEIRLLTTAVGEALGHKKSELKVARTNDFGSLKRTTPFLEHEIFNRYHSETEMLRYIRRLEAKDLSLGHSMIPLGSCTMKLNATTEMLPVTWPEFGSIHPFAPLEQAKGYQKLITQLEQYLCSMTGFDAFTLQPNAGSQGEYAGLLAIKKYHESNQDPHRTLCLIPASAHGTNPASAAMCGMKVSVVKCDENGNVDLDDLRAKSSENKDTLAALMITYPSTHGVFEEEIKEICNIVHENGGQVYMDGANFNAQVGYCLPPEFGADVCHLNLHKTFCIPHGGGGPGMGPIGVKKHLAPFLPNHPVVEMERTTQNSMGAISAAPWGSPSILPISWSYIRMMGADGLKRATEVAILNANYIADRLQDHFPVLYRGKNGRVAHECIVDLRPLKKETGVEVEDVAKRLMDYGFHAPTVSFPVAGTLMIEPTESEDLGELNRFCDAMIEIRKEIQEIKDGKADPKNNLLKNAPHTATMLVGDWTFPYERSRAVYPLAWVKERKFWPSVARIDNVKGDRNLICACPPMSDYE